MQRLIWKTPVNSINIMTFPDKSLLQSIVLQQTYIVGLKRLGKYTYLHIIKKNFSPYPDFHIIIFPSSCLIAETNGNDIRVRWKSHKPCRIVLFIYHQVPPIRPNILFISDLHRTIAYLIRCFMVGLVQSFMSSIKLSLPSRAKNMSLLGFEATER